MYSQFLRQLLSLFQPLKKKLIGVCGIIVVFEFFKLVPVYILAEILDRVLSVSNLVPRNSVESSINTILETGQKLLLRLTAITETFNDEKFIIIVALLACLFLVSNIVTVLEYFLDKKVLSFLVNGHCYLLKKCQEKLLKLPLQYHEENFTGKQVHLIHEGVFRIEDLFFNTFFNFIPTLIQVLMSFSVLLLVHVPAGLVFFAFVPIVFYLSHIMGRKLQPLRHAYHHQLDMAAGKFAEAIMHIRTVQDFAQEQYERKLYDDYLAKYRALRYKRDHFEQVFTAWRDLVLNIGRVSVIGYGVYLLAQGQISPGFFVLFVTLSEKAYLALFRIGRIYNHVGDSFEAVRRISELLSEKIDGDEWEENQRDLETSEEEVGETSLYPPKVGFAERTHSHRQDRHDPQFNVTKDVSGKTQKVDRKDPLVAFEHVGFAYLHGKNVLHDLSFTIERGQTVALVGRSGAGKSTVVKLLFRHFELDGSSTVLEKLHENEGRILFDGTDIRLLNKQTLRRRLAIVSQDIELFHTSIRDNILYGLKADEKELKRVCRIAYVDEFVQRFRSGYETLVGERGVRLSGGQKQRIAIARALLRKPQLLIFDEATSSLDSESEYLIQKAIFEISKDFTMIIIAHRLSTLSHAEKVFVLEQGRLVETGSFQELIERAGVFNRMVAMQKESRLRK